MSNVTLAIKTIAKIDAMIKADQGNAYRGWLKKVINHIGDAYRQDEEPHRGHLGASIVGQECPRAIWYSWRWATRSCFEGRMLRLFNRGHLEEARFIAAMLMIGCELYQQDQDGKQFSIKHADGHMGGSSDGVVIGCPDLTQGTPALSEFKTHNDKSFIQLAGGNWKQYYNYLINPKDHAPQQFEGEGVRHAKFEHFVQMQVYMRKMGLAVGLYMAVNKNDDSIYAELISLNPELADQFLERGEKIIWMDQPPTRINPSPGFFKCKFCDHYGVCHKKELPDRNCRTCVYSIPAPNAAWICRRHDKAIDRKTQLVGCQDYTVHKSYG